MFKSTFSWLSLMVFVAVYLNSLNACAVLKEGQLAPDFTTEAALGGQTFSFSLADALKQGPVVLYFFPMAFTTGCTVEAHLFAEATAEFAEYKATVIGISNDSIDKLKKFSVEECHNKFAVGADADKKIIKAYDARLWFLGNTSKRISYVITPDAKILFSYKSMSPSEHVNKTLNAVKQWYDSLHNLPSQQ